jgi:DNA repair protein RecN (Recombination protein N)
VRGLLDDYSQLEHQRDAQRWQQWRSGTKVSGTTLVLRRIASSERERLAWQIGELDKLAPGATNGTS